MALDLILMGPPGSGKSTQADRLSKEYGIPHVEAGELLRSFARTADPEARQAELIMARGELLPDSLVADIIQRRLSAPDTVHGFVLDGFPRTTAQIEILNDILEQIDRRIDAVIFLELPESSIVGRLLKRGRSEDTADVIRRRLEVFEAETAPVREHFREREKLIIVDAVGTPDEVHQRIVSALQRRGLLASAD